MRKKWYETDWFYIMVAIFSLIFSAVANYYVHGGHIQW